MLEQIREWLGSEADALLGAQEARKHVERLVQRLLEQTV